MTLCFWTSSFDITFDILFVPRLIIACPSLCCLPQILVLFSSMLLINSSCTYISLSPTHMTEYFTYKMDVEEESRHAVQYQALRKGKPLEIFGRELMLSGPTPQPTGRLSLQNSLQWTSRQLTRTLLLQSSFQRLTVCF